MSSLTDPAVYLVNLGPRLETINDLRDATGAPLMTRGELLVSDLQHGVTPLDLLDVVREEVRKIKQQSADRVPRIEEIEPASEQTDELQKLRDAANTALAHLEGRRSIFSTRTSEVVAFQLRKALGGHVNENRGNPFETD